ncbi:hypothetical protein BDW22DRAFT_1332315 [Trametopsis cervina]|nr:hypothetical protein BDW22DRAFT_1332315 [Trametopsis cervina]
MAKKNSLKSATAVSKAPQQPAVQFPSVSSKDYLGCRVLLEDQIILIDNFFTAEECKHFVRFIDGLPLEMTPPKKKGEAERVNQRISFTSPEFAQNLFSVISPHLPSFQYPQSVRRPANAPTERAVHSLNTNIRLYKYGPGQYFGPHYDDSVRDSVTGAKSEWTLLIYLTGVQDGVQGGETIFYKNHRNSPQEAVSSPLTRGTALLHRHGNECLLHEGSPVHTGSKYVLRSDLMFVN